MTKAQEDRIEKLLLKVANLQAENDDLRGKLAKLREKKRKQRNDRVRQSHHGKGSK